MLEVTMSTYNALSFKSNFEQKKIVFTIFINSTGLMDFAIQNVGTRKHVL